MKTLSASHVELFVGQFGTVKEAIERYMRGEIKSTSTPNVTEHFGMGGKRGMGMRGGKGMGRKMGGSKGDL